VLIDTGAQFSCVRSDVAKFLYLTGEPCAFSLCSVVCILVDGTMCEVTDAVKLHIKLLGFSWDHEFKMYNGGPFPVILGLDFLRQTTTVVDVASKRFSFRFAPHCSGEFWDWNEEAGGDPYLQNLTAEAAAGKGCWTRGS